MQTATATPTAVSSSLLAQRRHGAPPLLAPAKALYRGTTLTRRPATGRVFCEAAVTTADVSSSGATAAAPEGLDGDALAASKVYHVPKVPEIELEGMEGVIKQYVGLWKGKSISANLPFKVEFVLPDGVEGRPGPLKFVAHLREDEFEYLSQVERPPEKERALLLHPWRREGGAMVVLSVNILLFFLGISVANVKASPL
ncbi:unnamed protein product [Spirodela intermedia]|uniref:Ferredoxin thioredoxin reductase alpha chain domain-containing protein n=1 Tax=Spirodela intermedia TaxID=51605 RepID=A0A7I8ID56_SPIIN|nr:unnamed protein product [Spirodela intermedia]CAA6655696.1 unnamed protein product [Spirodela intermedia]